MRNFVLDTLRLATQGSGEYERFLNFCARHYKHSSSVLLSLYAQCPDAEMIASYSVWKNKVGRTVRRGETGYRALLANSDPLRNQAYQTLFSLDQTIGSKDTQPHRWTATPERLAELARRRNVTDVEDAIQSAVSEAYQQYFTTLMNEVPESYHTRLALTVDLDRAVKVSALQIVYARCGMESGEDFQFINQLTAEPEAFVALSYYVSSLSKHVLLEIERQMKRIIREERDRMEEKSNENPHPEPEPITQNSYLSQDNPEPHRTPLSIEDPMPEQQEDTLVYTVEALDEEAEEQNIAVSLILDETQNGAEDGMSDLDSSAENTVTSKAMEEQIELFAFPTDMEHGKAEPLQMNVPSYVREEQAAQQVRMQAISDQVSLLDIFVDETTMHLSVPNELAKDEIEPPTPAVPAISFSSADQVISSNALVHTQEVAVNYRIPDDIDQSGGPKRKFRQNIAAIMLLKRLEGEKRVADPVEQQILSLYAGWGGLPQAFDARNADWSDEYQELKKLLDEHEYDAARASTLNAHYTSIEIIDAIYDGLRRLGYDGKGNILEPAMGIGNFFGRLPDDMRQSRLYGVELDSISGRIASLLYPEANIQVKGFEKANIPDGSIDIAIGNVPFGNYTVYDSRYRNQRLLIHDYFLVKTLDKLRSGGIMAYITSSGTLDKEDTTCRTHLARHADLLGAIRLPNTAFRANAGTDVTTDIIFLRKREEPRLLPTDWLRSVESAEFGLRINAYYLGNREMMLGTPIVSTDMYGSVRTALAPYDCNLSELLAATITRLPEGSYEPARAVSLDGREISTPTLPADLSIKNDGFAVVEGQVYQRQGSIMVLYEAPKATVERIRALCRVKSALHQLIDAQLNNCSDEALHRYLRLLNGEYDTFARRFGPINAVANQRAYADDPDVHLLSSIEEPDPHDPKVYHKGPAFRQRTIRTTDPVEYVQTPSEALIVCVHETGDVRIDMIAKLCKMDEEQVLDSLQNERLIYHDPATSTWETAAAYLSGNVRVKLAQAEEAAQEDNRYAANIEALRTVIPDDLSPEDIDVRLGSVWIPSHHISNFATYLVGESVGFRAHYNSALAEWETNARQIRFRLYGNTRATMTFGTSKFTAMDLLELSLNRETPKVTYKDSDGRTYVDEEATAEAIDKMRLVKEEFLGWVWADPRRTKDLVRIYNDRFNALALRSYGNTLQLPGMSPDIELKPHQLYAISRVLYGEHNVLLAHAVGAGKTFEISAAAMELKRIGLARKPMIIVPNHLVEQWAAEWMRLYPAAHILVAGKKDFQKSRRRRLMARIATGEWDAVIIGHSSFGMVPLSKEHQEAFIAEELREVNQEIRDSEGSKTIKRLEREKKSLMAWLEKILDKKSDSDSVSFEELGVDYIFLDESHEFKNLGIRSKMPPMPGLTGTASQKAMDLLMKIQYLQDIHSGPRVTFATGTPLSNSIGEMYSTMRYLHIKRLKEMGIDKFDAWASVFGEPVTAFEVAPDGSGFRQKTRFAKFFNVPELAMLFSEVADIQTDEMLDLPKPKLRSGAEEIITAPKSEALQTILDDLVERSERIRNMKIDPTIDNMLKITGEGRKAALDVRLIDSSLPDDPRSKVNMAVQETYEIWTETAEKRSTQLIFCDLSTPGPHFNIYDDMKAKLIQMGIPEGEIAFIHDYESDKKKAQLFEEVRQGTVRILFGSTAKLGAGTNVQTRLVALHELDCPWRPTDITQREGRILRQGNENEEVRILRYITEGSFDSYSYQTVETKQRFINQIWNRNPARRIEDIDDRAMTYAEVKAIATGNSLIMERHQVDTEISRLSTLLSGHRATIGAARRRIDGSPKRVKQYDDQIVDIKKVLAKIQPYEASKKFAITIAGTLYTERPAAGEALYQMLRLLPSEALHGSSRMQIGEISGIPIRAFSRSILQFDGVPWQIEIGDSATGAMLRIEHALASNRLENEINRLTQEKKNHIHEIADLTLEIAKPWPYSEQLRILQERQAEIIRILDLDKQEKQMQNLLESNAKPVILI